MKICYTVVLLILTSAFSKAQNLEITDPVLKNILVNTNCSDTNGDGITDADIDTDDDGEVSYDEAAAVLRLYIDGPVTSMTGFEGYAFSSLRLFSLQHTQLTSYYMENFGMIEEYHITYNSQLTSLNFSNVFSYGSLDCSNNNLGSLQFGGYINLSSIDCSNNHLGALNLHGAQFLTNLDCSNNNIQNVNLHGLSALTSLNCANNALTNLVTLKDQYSPFVDLTFSGNPSLSTICCNVEDQVVFQNKISEYGLSGVSIATNCTYEAPPCVPETICFTKNDFKFFLLSQSSVDANGDGEIQYQEAAGVTDLLIGGNTNNLVGLEYFTGLTNLEIYSTQVQFIDVTALTNLQTLKIQQHVNLGSIYIGGLTNLTSLTVKDNQILASISAAGLTSLQEVFCNANGLSSLSFPGAVSLVTVDCSENRLSNLNLADAVNLTSLDAHRNNLQTLTLGATTSLINLDFSLNRMTNLNFSSFSNLENLNFANNRFTTVNFSGLSSVQTIDCSVNNVYMLDASNLPALTSLVCNQNDIMTDLFLKNDNSNADLLTLNIDGNYSLEHICADAVDFPLVQSSINSSSLNGITLNSTCICSGSCTDNIVYIPDANFKTRLLYADTNNYVARNLRGIYFKIDANNDGEIQRSEAAEVQSIDVNRGNIASMEGIGSFVNLAILDCYQNAISSLDLSNCSRLFYLNANINNIVSLDISGLTNLQWLDITNNQLITLDLSQQTRLDHFTISSPQLTTLFLKNGVSESVVGIINTPNLEYICADESQVDSIAAMMLANGNTTCAVNSYCSFTPGGLYYTIKGESRYDMDGNGCTESDATFHNMKINVNNGDFTNILIGDSSAAYNYYAQVGQHTVTPVLENPTYFNVSPPVLNVDFPTMESPLIQNFCITANGIHPDLEIAIIPVRPAVPGFNATYKLVYRNKGTNTQSGTILFGYNTLTSEFSTANPAPSVNSDGYLMWNFSDLLPYEIRSTIVTFEINPPTGINAVNAGDVLQYLCEISSEAVDEMPIDNRFILSQTVVNSFDPNDKTCLQGITIGPQQVGNYVHYLIRFENTGTFPAQNIVVKDIIDHEKFDVNSLIPVSGSAPFVTRISGNKVEFILEDINLPFDDANNDGYLVFKIKTLPTLTVGDTFSNSASIYFDYNFPVITDPAITTITALEIADFAFADYFTIYPNPSKDVLNIQPKSNIEVKSISIYNLLGQLVQVVTNGVNNSIVDVSNLRSGNYFIKINTEKGTLTAKFVKE